MYQKISYGKVTIGDAELLRRRNANRDYMLRLKTENLLISYAMEAGVTTGFGDFDCARLHGGWESLVCQVRGHFLGHWLSAAAMHYAATGETLLKARADDVVDKLAFYQQENGGRWVCSIPEKYLHRIAEGKPVWAPQYTIHKTLMGLTDMYLLAGSQKALEVALNLARWFYDWTGGFTREQLDDVLDVETGGMLEVWAELYGITNDEFLRELMYRYYRGRLFDALLAGGDPLTNMHANTTIPEALGAARAYEVTGDKKWMDICAAYWEQAVTRRGMYATGGQTCGEVWSPPNAMSARLGDKTQEHCTVYNMMRLAEFLFRHTGEAAYADYRERNLYNGVMAQTYWRGGAATHGIKSDYPDTGLISYFLPLRSGGRKGWGSETNDFFCCHGTTVQANAAFTDGIYYKDETGVAICQFFDSAAHFEMDGAGVEISLCVDQLNGGGSHTSVQERLRDEGPAAYAADPITTRVPHNPDTLAMDIRVKCVRETAFTLRLRLPRWANGYALAVNDAPVASPAISKGFIEIACDWTDDAVRFEISKKLEACPLPDEPETVAFMYGPVLLAGLNVTEERTLYGDKNDPASILIPDNEREWSVWQNTFRTKNQERGIRFVPLNRIGYEPYAVYFPVKSR